LGAAAVMQAKPSDTPVTRPLLYTFAMAELLLM